MRHAWIAGIAALVCSFALHAQTGSASIACTPPIQNTNGTPITGTITYKFYKGTSSTSFPLSSPPQTSCAYTWTGLAVGTHFFVATATVNGVESVFSNVAQAVVPPSPNAPSGLTVTVTVTVSTP